MHSKKHEKEIARLKYFPKEYIDDFRQDLEELEKEKEIIKNRLGSRISIVKIFDSLDMDQKLILYQLVSNFKVEPK